MSKLYLPDGSTYEPRWDGPPTSGMATVEAKAATGPGVGFYDTGTPLSVFSRSPQDLMKQGQAAYTNNMWVGTAEDTINGRVVGLPWHLEDEEGEEPDTANAQKVTQLLERPQENLRRDERKPGTLTRRLMWTRTSRDLGLCGMSYWYGDRMDVQGIPEAWLYINPARMWPAEDDNGNVTGWLLDPKNPGARNPRDMGGLPLDLREVLPFYLSPPDWGNLGSGVYERARLQVQVGNLAAQHAGYVLGTGGRIAGIVSPKEGTIPDEKFKVIVNEFRNLNERPDAAKRTTIMQGPMDFHATAADPEHLDLVNLAKMNRDDIFTNWGIPSSQAGAEAPVGLNSGGVEGYKEAILMQGAVHTRVEAIRETLQFGWLDKYEPQLQLVIEEPEFDDETPAYDRMEKARFAALTNAQRWDIIGLPPTGDPAIDNAILIPSETKLWATAPGEGETAGTIAAPPVPVAPFGSEGAAPPTEPEVKASAPREFLGLRKSVDTKIIPAAHKSVTATLEAQRAGVVKWLRSHPTYKLQTGRGSSWWNEAKENDRLEDALRPHVAEVADKVTQRAKDVLDRGKADFEDTVAAELRTSVGKRIKDINDVTRERVAEAIKQGFDQGLSVTEIADLIEGSTWFGEARAEVIARTETAFAYNTAALTSYREFNVEHVDAIDGDRDEECAARVAGNPYTIEQAMSIQDHPNGTLDWSPVFAKATPVSAPAPFDLPALIAAIAALKAEPVTIVQTSGQRLTRTIIERDEYTGKVIGTREEYVDAS